MNEHADTPALTPASLGQGEAMAPRGGLRISWMAYSCRVRHRRGVGAKDIILVV